jgi:hypothetical protein
MVSPASRLLTGLAALGLSLSQGGCVGMVVGTAMEATGAVAVGAIKTTGKVAGATVGAGADIVTGGGRDKDDED